MKFSMFKIVLFVLLGNSIFYSQAFSKTFNNLERKNYQAVVLGKITESRVKKLRNYYITEYKLKPKQWLFKDPSVKKSDYITIKVLGAELPRKGIVIKASTSPDYIPIKKDAIFLLENTKKKEKNMFTLSKNGIITKDKLEEIKKEI